MNNILAVFRDHSDMHGILTYSKPSEVVEGGPQSIVKLCKDNQIKQCFGVSRYMNSFIEAWKNLKKEEIQYHFGLELIMCDDAKVHDEVSLKNNHKIVIFFKNNQGYKDLIQIYTAAHANRDNYYREIRFDYSQLKKLWTDNLVLVLPFCDSFIHKNLLTFATIVPDLPTKPIIFREIESDLPYAELINKALDEFNKNKEYEEQNVKTICYNKREDVKSYQIYRAIQLRTIWNKPEMEFFCSDKFSFDSYLSIKNAI